VVWHGLFFLQWDLTWTPLWMNGMLLPTSARVNLLPGARDRGEELILA
jgi:hypothetical protein